MTTNPPETLEQRVARLERVVAELALRQRLPHGMADLLDLTAPAPSPEEAR